MNQSNYHNANSSSGLLNTALSLVGGAAVGAGLMYLFDPEQGRDRRESFGETLSDAASSAASGVGGASKAVGVGTAAAATGVASGASSVWDTIASRARDLADSISESTGAGRSKSRFGLPLMSSRADRSWGDRVSTGWGTAKAAVGLGERDEWESDEDDTSPVTAPVAGLGVLGLVLAGTVTAYLLMDPNKRRAATDSLARAGRSARGLGTRLGMAGR
ncbi:MAG TPA: hypothetical protein VK324_03425, partial [Tepidisphaeraceae bacterium]|nr:hypothetical protein [Tepidisphaeraceae bacterium]